MSSPLIRPALDKALRDAKLEPRDAAAGALAKRYASMIDEDPDVIGDLGPKLLAALTALGLTPAGRGKAKGGDSGAVAGALDELRARREQRAVR